MKVRRKSFSEIQQVTVVGVQNLIIWCGVLRAHHQGTTSLNQDGNHDMIYNRAILVWNYSCYFNLNLRCALVQFWNHTYDFSPNSTPLSSITTSLQPFWNRPNTGLGQFKCFIDAVLSWFEIKFIHFLWGKNKSFELQNLPHDTLCLSFSCKLIGYFKQALKSDRLFCFYCILIGWEKDAI